MNRRSSHWRALTATLIVAALTACSAPTLEDPRCADAQDRVRRFYSLHFDQTEKGADAANPASAYLTERLTAELGAMATGEKDYFTAGDRFPRAFRVGTCALRGDRNAELDVLLLWRTDERSEQKKVRVKMTKARDAWLIDGVTPL